MIVVGAPVHERGWILRDWFDHLAWQTIGSDQLSVVLNYGASDDDTAAIISAEQQRGRFRAVTILVDAGDDHRATRQWGIARYETMVRLRNALLEHVRFAQPEYYLSCDTDMLLAPDTIEKLLAEMHGGWGAIAPLTHMTPAGKCANAFNVLGERYDPDLGCGVEKVYAAFGTVLMGPLAYGEDYAVHPQGEDIGWAANLWRKRIPVAIAPDIKVKHVMNRQMLDPVDIRIGF